MEKEERNSTNMTVGVVLTVAVAILLLVAMIPAMMPAGEDEGETPYVTSLDFTDGSDTMTMMYNDTELATITLASYTSPANYSYTFVHSSPTSCEIRATSGKIEVYTGGALDINGIVGISQTVRSVEEFAESVAFVQSSQPGAPSALTPAVASYTISPTAPANTPSIATLLWEAFFVGTHLDPGFDPAHPEPSDSGVDTNTVLIGAIISLMFISIALVAVRSFRA